MTFLEQYLFFLAETFTWVFAILFLVGGLLNLTTKRKKTDGIQIIPLHEHYDQLKHQLEKAVFSKKAYKEALKAAKKALKAEKSVDKPKVFVLHFQGDLKASAVESLREEITAILTLATEQDEVVVCVESGGGMVHSYGLAASQLQRIRDKRIPLTVVVDKIAASGGYMMACVANKVLAAPFSIIGSIGVVMQLPNFNRLLKKYDIDYEQLTAGQYKRTLTLLGENTELARQKVQEELEEAHTLFKTFIQQHRPQVDLARIATGEHWFGIQAKTLLLVDENQTSDEYLLQACQRAAVYKVSYEHKKKWTERFSQNFQQWLDRTLNGSGQVFK